jgi:hypothetical protein
VLSPRTERDYRQVVERWTRDGQPDPASWVAERSSEATMRNARAGPDCGSSPCPVPAPWKGAAPKPAESSALLAQATPSPAAARRSFVET